MDVHAKRIAGNAEGLVLAIHSLALSPAAKNALDRSFEALGYGASPCCYASLEGLGSDEVFDIVEGIDPIALVATDAGAAALYARAVSEEFPLGAAARVFGHAACAFQNLNDMLSTPEDKQMAWHLLKSLSL